jgi:hypothetical protein
MPGRKANQAPPPSVMLEMCVHIHRPHISWHVVFVKPRGMYFFVPCLKADPDRSVSMSVCPVTATVPVHGKYMRCAIKCIPLYIHSCSGFGADTVPKSGTELSALRLSILTQICRGFSQHSYECSGYCIKSNHHVACSM